MSKIDDFIKRFSEEDSDLTFVDLMNSRNAREEMFSGLTDADINALIDAIPQIKAKRMAMYEREARKAAVVRKEVLPVVKQIQAKKAKEAREKAERGQAVKARLDALETEIRAEAEHRAQAEEDEKQAREERERKRKIEEKLYKEWQKKNAESPETKRKVKEEAEKRAEAQRAARVKTAIDRVDRILSEGDDLTVDLKNLPWKSPDEAKQLQEAFDSLENRVFMHKRKWQL